MRAIRKAVEDIELAICFLQPTVLSSVMVEIEFLLQDYIRLQKLG